MTSSPGCASIERPSMVTVTVVFGAASSDVAEVAAVAADAVLGASGMGGLARFGAPTVNLVALCRARLDVQGDGHAAAGDLRLELGAEATDGAHHRRHRGGAERADRGLAGREGHRGQARLLEAGGGVGTGADVVADVEQQVDV